MARDRWHVLRAETGLTLARHLPVRFDVRAETWLPGGSALRLAHQIRQDLWRTLQRVRGFSPVVRLSTEAGGWRVEAGGRVGAPFDNMAARITSVLEHPGHRARWLQYARERDVS